ncbi:MAG: Arm DNA-binding domain-containing protein [Terracidiphilus sp.]
MGVLFFTGEEWHGRTDRYGNQTAKAAEIAYSLGDGGDLYLWVKPTGGKLWRWSYRYEGKEKLMSLGKYPDVS